MPDTTILQTIPEHPFAPYVRILGKGKKGSRSFTESEAIEAMDMILNDQVEDLQLGAFLMLLRVKEETAEELSGFVKAVKKNIAVPAKLSADLDWSSYAGKRRHLPWYVFSIILLAQAGHRVFIHGASGHTQNRLYTESVLTELGFNVAQNWEQVATQLDQFGFSYMPLRHISPILARIIDMRNTLGLRSPVHSLSRLINPLDAPNVLQGIFHPPYAALHQEAGQLLGYDNLAVIKGEGGEIERNPDNALTVYSTVQSKLSEDKWDAMFPRRHVKAQEMSVTHMKQVWAGEVDDEYGIGAVIGTCALALRTLNKDLSQEESLDQSRALWQNRQDLF